MDFNSDASHLARRTRAQEKSVARKETALPLDTSSTNRLSYIGEFSICRSLPPLWERGTPRHFRPAASIHLIGKISFPRSGGRVEGQRQRRAVRAVIWRFVTSATRVVGSCSSWGTWRRCHRVQIACLNSRESLREISWCCQYWALHYW